MSEQTSFGRRQAPPAPMTRAVAAAPPLSPEAEAFRAQLAAGQKPSDSDFAKWRRTRQARRYIAWFVAFVLLCPGALCFVFNAPASVSAGLSVAGIIANVWLRRERKRHLQDIAAWQAPS